MKSYFRDRLPDHRQRVDVVFEGNHPTIPADHDYRYSVGVGDLGPVGVGCGVVIPVTVDFVRFLFSYFQEYFPTVFAYHRPSL